MAPSPKPDNGTANDLIANGPALFYVSTQDANGTQTVQRIDLAAPSSRREQAVCRALLHHALALLDEAEYPAGLLTLTRSGQATMDGV